MAEASERSRSPLVALLLTAAIALGCGAGREEDDDEGEDEISAPEVCSSHSTSHVEEGPGMRPGGDCIGCHASEDEGPRYTIAGTVMVAGHDDTNCNGFAGVNVVVTGADGAILTLVTNDAGNFFSNEPTTMPLTAKVVLGGEERAMMAAQSTGACNSCHTAAGANGAPGRIVAP